MAMNTRIGLENCLSFINCQLQPGRWPLGVHQNGRQKRGITISRQSGAGGHEIAERLARRLNKDAAPEACPWTMVDRELVERVLEDHHLPKRLARFMGEDRVSEMTDTLDELFGLHPPSWILVRKTAETILHLAELGNVIVIGRGANVITAKLGHMFHVRLIGSLARRVAYHQQANNLSREAALKLVNREDRGRERYLKKYFKADIDDPLLYHLVINTDLVSKEEAADLIFHEVALQPKVSV